MAADETRLDADRRKALTLAISQIEKQLGKGSIMRMGADSPRERIAVIPTGAINLDAAIGIGGIPRGRITEIYGPESSGKTTLCLHLVANVQKAGRRRGLRRRGARARHRVRPQARRRRRQPPRVAARHRRAGARDRRDPGPLRRGGHRRHRLGGGAGAQGGDRGRDGRQPRGPAGAAHEPGAAQAGRRHQPLQLRGGLHQPAAREDRRHVRQPGDHHRRQGAQVLRVASGSTSAASARSRSARSSSATTCGSRWSRTRWRRRSGRRSSTSCSTRASATRRCSWTSPPRRTSSRSRAPGTPTATSASGRAARTPSSSSGTTRRSCSKSRGR